MPRKLAITTPASSTPQFRSCSNAVPLPPVRKLFINKCVLGLSSQFVQLDLLILECSCSHGSSKVCFRFVCFHVHFLKKVWMSSTNSLSQQTVTQNQIANNLYPLGSKFSFPVANQQVNPLWSFQVLCFNTKEEFRQLFCFHNFVYYGYFLQSIANKFMSSHSAFWCADPHFKEISLGFDLHSYPS